MKRFQFVTCLILVLAACSPKVDMRGYRGEDDWKTIITVGQTNKGDILNHYGSPSAQSSFGNETWYYISSTKEAVAFLKPEVAQQQVVKIEFDAAGVVSSVDAYSEEDSKELEVVKRTTPTEGHSMNFFEQIMGNVGRFNKPGGSTGAPGGPSGGGR